MGNVTALPVLPNIRCVKHDCPFWGVGGTLQWGTPVRAAQRLIALSMGSLCCVLSADELEEEMLDRIKSVCAYR